MLRPRKPKTAPGIIILHWVMALVLLACVVSGLGVAVEHGAAPALKHAGPLAGSRLMSVLPLLPLNAVASLMLAGIAAAYLWRLREQAGAARTARRDAFARGGSPAWRRANTLFAQCFFALVALQLVVAFTLLAGAKSFAGLHLGITLLLIVSVPLHIGLQFALGRDHALKILRPLEIAPATIPLGQTRPTASGLRLVTSPRLYGFALGLVFGAAAAAAFLAADRPSRLGDAGPALHMALRSVTGAWPQLSR